MTSDSSERGRPRLSIIVAEARNRVIGRDNTIPWRLPEDLRHFKETTLGHTLIMGRKTFESIGRPLPGRRTIVVTQTPGWQAAGVSTATSLGEALAQAADVPEVFVVGGARLYAEAMASADRLIVTEVELEPEGDVHFPVIDSAAWLRHPGARQTSERGIHYTIVHYERRQP